MVLVLTLPQSHFPGENAAIFFAAVAAIHTVPIFVLPATHYCCVDQAMWIQSLPKSFTNDRHCWNLTLELLILGPAP